MLSCAVLDVLRWMMLGVLVAFVPSSAAGLQIQTLNVSAGLADGPERITQGSVGRWQVATDVGVQSLEALAFETRYVAIGAVEFQGSRLSNDWTIDFTITLDVVADPGVQWALLLEVERSGQADIVKATSGTGSWVHVEALGGTVTGAEVVAGSLVLPRPWLLVYHPTDAGVHSLPFAQTTSAELRGIGQGTAQSISLRFTGSPNRMSSQDAEVAIRMGLADGLDNFIAGAYPGLGARTQADDGVFVRAQLVAVPEPALGLLVGLGISALSRAHRDATRRTARTGS